MFREKRKGQSILEYAILMGVIVAVVIAIQIYVKRAVHGNLKSRADQIGEQFTTGEVYTKQNISQTARREERLTGDADGTGAWEKSKIQAKDDAAWMSNLGAYQQKGGDYKGAEINVTDYVEQDTGAGVVGVHGTMDSGVLKDVGLFQDDE